MKKSIIVIGVLILVILCEIAALIYKSKNPEPTVFALDIQEYDLPNLPAARPFIFETDFVENTDAVLKNLAEEVDNGFGVHLAHIFNRQAVQEQEEIAVAAEKKKKLDDFRQAMAADPVAIRGAYIGDNLCEVDGVRGVCANGVYKLGKHCIACYEGLCAGTTCAEEAESIVAQPDDEETVAEEETETVEEVAAEDIEPAAEVVKIDDEDGFINEVLGEEVKLPEKTPEIVPESAPAKAGTPANITETAEPEIAVVPEAKVAPAKEKAVPAAQKGEALVAVVIDDIGLSVPFTNQMANIGYPITVSFLPYGASNKEQVNKLKNAGLEVMLHAPMMPRVPADLAPVTLSPKMSKAEIQDKLKAMIERFAGTGMNGVNNHMGSAFTENREAMAAVMEVLKERGMFFLDSKTTSRSVGRAVSSEYGVPYVARDVFLDNERRYDYIMGQFRATENIAKKNGYAIAIGHPYQQTLQALRDWLKDTEKRGIKIVPLSDLVAKNN